MATIKHDADDNSDSFGSLSDEDVGEEDALQSDTWIEELECALLADCDPATLKKICEGKRIPATLAMRPEYWRTLLALNDAGNVKLTNEYDLPNQADIRQDCEKLVEDISKDSGAGHLNGDAERLRLRSDFESTLTTYVKARPELYYVPDNGWIDILKVLHNLHLSDTQNLYQMFYRIVDRYIPKDLSPAPRTPTPFTDTSSITNITSESTKKIKPSSPDSGTNIKPDSIPPTVRADHQKQVKKSVQAYHLLRLLIQYHDPELCSILDSRKVTPDLYVKDWFCSLFARSCSPKLALQIWDMHFKMADPFLIFFAAIVMVVNASDELKKSNLSQADMLSILGSMPSKLEEDDIEDLYYLVSNHYTNSTPRSIRSYSHLFFMDTFGNTYMGHESPEDGPSLVVDMRSTRLASSIDLSQYLCLPIVPAEIFASDTSQQRSSPTHQSSSAVKYFLVDCRPAEQYNAGHLTKAFHLDCSLMLREPSSFAAAVQALLEIQKQIVASKSNTGGQHLCFIGSGQEEEDRYVNMVVASFLQKYQKYVSIVYGGFDAIHDYVQTKSELKDSFSKYIVDHNEDSCKACCLRTPGGIEKLREMRSNNVQPSPGSGGSGLSGSVSFNSAQSLFTSTTNFFKGDKSALSTNNPLSKLATSNPQATTAANMIAQSGASMFDKFATAFVSKSNSIKDRLVETLSTTNLPSTTTTSTFQAARSHVSSSDRLGPRYTGSSGSHPVDSLDDLHSRRQHDAIEEEPCQEIQIDAWQRETKIIALYKCSQIKGNVKYPGYIALTKTHLWILREIPHNKGFASIAAKRPLDMVVQITSKRRQQDFIIFRYGYARGNRNAHSNRSSPDRSTDQAAAAANSLHQNTNSETQAVTSRTKDSPTIVASDHLQIPDAFEVIRLIKREIVRIMDENANKQAQPAQDQTDEPSADLSERLSESDKKEETTSSHEQQQATEDTTEIVETNDNQIKETEASPNEVSVAKSENDTIDVGQTMMQPDTEG